MPSRPVSSFEMSVLDGRVTQAHDDRVTQLLEFQAQQRKCLEQLVSQRGKDVASLTLPQPDVLVFDGDPINYNLFISAFENLIESKTDSSSARLFYLIQHMKGDVQELLKGCLTKPAEVGYSDARILLKDSTANHLRSRTLMSNGLSTDRRFAMRTLTH